MLSENDYPIFLGSEIEQPKPEEAFFHIIPIPYEETVSYGGGTSRGPAAILAASWQLETFDNFSSPCEMGIYTRSPVSVSGTAEQVMGHIAAATQAVRALGKMPVGIGGEHSVTWGLIQGLLDAGETDFGVVQIDAHADLRDRYEGHKHSHASVMRLVVEAGVPLFQLGIRAYCEEEMRARRDYQVGYLDAHQLVPSQVQEFQLPEHFPGKVFFTLDVDGLDPSVFPATGTPVPGGLGWYQTLNLFESVARQREIIGFDLLEFAPIEGFHAYDFAAAQLLYRLMGIIQRNRPQAATHGKVDNS
ncbi:agmatinase [Microbulbifer sp. 2205BS26-8]|uniref:agmatinase n=1 Tax=Microbulbifer sp. 2205BS26-8 TaxID=3064386 RepID=UPI00273DD860|nr:agmatinase [Microbulbifer sp. 2205BS26-8]MDP5210251.1 agmatinase [Microbulbifer sp. 2205BS26-8]